MAQAVFAEHPLEQYLLEAGEGLEIMPGSTLALTQELEIFPLSSLTEAQGHDSNQDNIASDVEWQRRLHPLVCLLQYIQTLIVTAQATKSSNPLAERFKYNVISSSLLSPDLPTPYIHHTRIHHSSIPGSLSHSRSSSEVSQTRQHSTIPTSYPAAAPANEAQFGLLSGLVVLFATLLSVRLVGLAILVLWMSLGGMCYLRVQGHTTRLLDLTPCLETLDELLSVNIDWETIVQEVVAVLEQDERTILDFSVPTTYSSPVSPLRVAFHSTLQTTQNQFDNVRHLLSALASPSDLSQLSEMYAPPSPMKQNFSINNVRSTKAMSYSAQKRRRRPTSIPCPSVATTNFMDHKRMTWNGSHHCGTFVPVNSSPTTPITKRRIKHRSDSSTFLGNSTSTYVASFSAPVTPAPSSPLTRVSEDIYDDDLDATLLDNSLGHSHESDEIMEEEYGTTSFAAAALKLQRNRSTVGLEAFGLPTSPCLSPLSSPPRSYPCSLPLSNTPGNHVLPTSPRSTFIPSSRFTAIHTSRQPLSLTALRHTLQAALGAKRYACAHLLALRFHEEGFISVTTPTAASIAFCGDSVLGGTTEAEGTYWDDVKSVMQLLIGAFSDATLRLREAMREVEAMRLRDMTPTPVGSIDGGSGSPDTGKSIVEEMVGQRKRLSKLNPSTLADADFVSFAPMPSQLSRFAGHVAAIQSALGDARGYLEECTRALNDSDAQTAATMSVNRGPKDDGATDMEEHPALRAYEKLRRELGFALRECERGRNHLLDLVKQPQLPDMDHEDGSEAETPGFEHDSLSEESDKADNIISPLHSEDGMKDNAGIVSADAEAMVDDASRELLLSTDVAHLPPAHLGLEQVFETDTSAISPMPIRQKTNLSREERIKLVKARRESSLGLGMTRHGLGVDPVPSSVINDKEGGYTEQWGPGGDVVQELKDVIWKVGERRRKVHSQQPAPQESQPSPLRQLPDEDQCLLLPTTRESRLPSSLNTPGHQGPSIPFARPKSAARVSMVSPSVRHSMDFSPSLIPRRTSMMNMRNILSSLQKEVNEVVDKDRQESDCVLSSE